MLRFKLAAAQSPTTLAVLQLAAVEAFLLVVPRSTRELVVAAAEEQQQNRPRLALLEEEQHRSTWAEAAALHRELASKASTSASEGMEQ